MFSTTSFAVAKNKNWTLNEFPSVEEWPNKSDVSEWELHYETGGGVGFHSIVVSEKSERQQCPPWVRHLVRVCIYLCIILSALERVCVCVCVCVCAQSCPTLCDPLDCSPSGSSVHGIRLEWVTISYSRGSSWPSLLHWQMDFLPLCHLEKGCRWTENRLLAWVGGGAGGIRRGKQVFQKPALKISILIKS